MGAKSNDYTLGNPTDSTIELYSPAGRGGGLSQYLPSSYLLKPKGTVTVQPLTAKTGFREFEQQREHAERGFPTIATEENADDEPDGSTLNSKDIINGHGVKVRLFS
eukprot:Gb_20633 [translate_table: standard]